MFARPKSGKAETAVKGSGHKRLIIPAAAVLAALYCYYLLFEFKKSAAGALSGELIMGGSSLQQAAQEGGLTAVLCDYFGSFVYVLPLLLILVALLLSRIPGSFRQWDFFKAGLRLLGFNTCLLGGTALLAAIYRGSTAGSGGILGEFLISILHSLIGVPLTAAASLLLTLTGVLLLTGHGPLQLFDSMGALVFGLLERIKGSKQENAAAAGKEQQAEASDAISADSFLETAPEGGVQELQDLQIREFNAPAGRPEEPAGPQAGSAEELQPWEEPFNADRSAAAEESREYSGDYGRTEPDFSAAAAGLAPAAAGPFQPEPGYSRERVEPDFGSAFASSLPPQQSQPAAIPAAGQNPAWTDDPYYPYQGQDRAAVSDREQPVSTIITRSSAPVTPAETAATAPVATVADQGPSTIVTVGSTVQEAEPAPAEDPALTDPNVVHTVITYNQPEEQPADDNEVHTNIFTTPIISAGIAVIPEFSGHGIPPAGSPGNGDEASSDQEFSRGSEAAAGNVLNFADFASPLYDRDSGEPQAPAAVTPPAAAHSKPAYDGLRDEREHIKEKDLAVRYPTASRGVRGSSAAAAPKATAEPKPHIPAAEPQPAEPVAETPLPAMTAAETPVPAMTTAEPESLDTQAASESWLVRDPEPAEELSAQALTAGEVPVPELAAEAEEIQEAPAAADPWSVREPEPAEEYQVTPAPQLPEEGSPSREPVFGYSVGQNSNTSNLPAYLQDTANGQNVEERGAPLISKPLDFSFIPSSVSAPKTFYDSWRPSLDLLTPAQHSSAVATSLLDEQAQRIDRVLKDFNIRAHVVSYESGPVITRYALQLDPGVRFASINNLVQDLERNLKVQTNSVRAISSLPGTIYAGLEVPSPQRRLISMHEVAVSQTFEESRAELPLCLGEDVVGNPVVVDLATAPHLLIAGTTGSGKSACLNAMLMSLLLKRSPAELRLLLIDPKRLEFSPYNGLPHLLTEVISDVADKTGAALQWCIEEMERRYKLIEAFNVRKLSEYNDIIEQAALNNEQVLDPAWTPEMGGQPPALKKLPYIVIVIEEFADLMAQTSGRGKKGEDSPEQSLSRLAAKSRACGIHIILATQTPRSEIITGTIRANMPSRIALTVQNHIESQLVLGESGAECLLGNGDMLSKFNGYNRNASFRAHGAFVFNEDVARVVAAWKEHGSPEYIENITERPADAGELDDGGDSSSGGSGGSRRDALFDKAAEYAQNYYQSKQKPVPISELQVVFGIGYARAKRLVVLLKQEGLLTGE